MQHKPRDACKQEDFERPGVQAVAKQVGSMQKDHVAMHAPCRTPCMPHLGLRELLPLLLLQLQLCEAASETHDRVRERTTVMAMICAMVKEETNTHFTNEQTNTCGRFLSFSFSSFCIWSALLAFSSASSDKPGLAGASDRGFLAAGLPSWGSSSSRFSVILACNSCPTYISHKRLL